MIHMLEVLTVLDQSYVYYYIAHVGYHSLATSTTTIVHGGGGEITIVTAITVSIEQIFARPIAQTTITTKK